MVLDEQPTGFKNGGFLKTSQLHKCGFAYIWYPLMVSFWKPVNYISVDLLIFDTPYCIGWPIQYMCVMLAFPIHSFEQLCIVLEGQSHQYQSNTSGIGVVSAGQ
jgi:hypothetical protein